MSYGYLFRLNRSGIWLMLNGRMFSFYRGLNTGKWTWATWSNHWRKTGQPCPRPTAKAIVGVDPHA